MTIPEESKPELVGASLHLLRVVSDIYGSEKAMEFWSSLSDVIDPELKGLTFTAMLTGGAVKGQLTISYGVNSSGYMPRLEIIKAIRTWGKHRPGLKEAKDMADAMQERKSVTLEINYTDHSRATTAFHRLGCIIV